ncbi:zinc-binding dehydrogenase [Nocardia sp. NBC_00511]|uniref:zinc-binding dehydrogenase n=1 Tax=Nocardia sp. NBC_00511 TaxID=2903591 RepID=UPI002F90CFEE
MKRFPSTRTRAGARAGPRHGAVHRPVQQPDRPLPGGRLRSYIQQTYPFDRAADAHRDIETRHVRGKIALTRN